MAHPSDAGGGSHFTIVRGGIDARNRTWARVLGKLPAFTVTWLEAAKPIVATASNLIAASVASAWHKTEGLVSGRSPAIGCVPTGSTSPSEVAARAASAGTLVDRAFLEYGAETPAPSPVDLQRAYAEAAALTWTVLELAELMPPDLPPALAPHSAAAAAAAAQATGQDSGAVGAGIHGAEMEELRTALEAARDALATLMAVAPPHWAPAVGALAAALSAPHVARGAGVQAEYRATPGRTGRADEAVHLMEPMHLVEDHFGAPPEHVPARPLPPGPAAPAPPIARPAALLGGVWPAGFAPSAVTVDRTPVASVPTAEGPPRTQPPP